MNLELSEKELIFLYGRLKKRVKCYEKPKCSSLSQVRISVLRGYAQKNGTGISTSYEVFSLDSSAANTPLFAALFSISSDETYGSITIR